MRDDGQVDVGLDPGALKRYIKVRDERTAISAEDRALRDEQKVLEEQIADGFTAVGVSSLNIDGRCIYIATTERARPAGGDHAAAVRALIAAGHDELITLGAQKVSKYIRDLPEAQREAELMEAFEVYEQVTVGCRKAGV